MRREGGIVIKLNFSYSHQSHVEEKKKREDLWMVVSLRLSKSACPNWAGLNYYSLLVTVFFFFFKSYDGLVMYKQSLFLQINNAGCSNDKGIPEHSEAVPYQALWFILILKESGDQSVLRKFQFEEKTKWQLVVFLLNSCSTICWKTLINDIPQLF